ncbi:MAG: hypothetical protein RLZZ398_666 [Verrucomicrobiota bacterium]|jgi:hypothetical protein
MRFPAVCLSLFAVIAVAAAGTPQENALDNLLSERDSDQAFATVIETARKAGVSEQAVLEARFLYHIDRREDDAIAALLPAFLKQREAFKIQDSAIFGVKEDWLAVVEYVQAIASLKEGNKDAFKSHITEAFWLSPRQASAFAPHIERMRLEEAMQAVKIDFETRLIPLGGGEAVVLKNLMADKKAMILHFWSPASKECEASLPDFVTSATALGEKGVAMISLLPEDSPELLTNAREMIRPLGGNPPGAWVIDHKERPLARELRVQTLPVFVLISNEGRVLFNGDPADDGLWEALKKVDPQLIRPEAGEETE